jgi:hypothetical protein
VLFIAIHEKFVSWQWRRIHKLIKLKKDLQRLMFIKNPELSDYDEKFVELNRIYGDSIHSMISKLEWEIRTVKLSIRRNK